MKLNELLERGFDESTKARRGVYTVRCSACAPCVINGVPVHERGCPSATHECAGCNARVTARQKYCADCAI